MLVPLFLYVRKGYMAARRNKVIATLQSILFPEGDNQKTDTIEDMMQLTSNRFTTDQLLDYYLKIKGLQLLDLNTMKDESICKFLMEPTIIRLRYDELVLFYEKFINYPQVHGLNAVGGIAKGV